MRYVIKDIDSEEYLSKIKGVKVNEDNIITSIEITDLEFSEENPKTYSNLENALKIAKAINEASWEHDVKVYVTLELELN